MPPNIETIKQMMIAAKSSGNPNAILGELLAKNPQMNDVLKCINEHGGDPRTAFYSLAKEKGVDPNSILQMLK